MKLGNAYGKIMIVYGSRSKDDLLDYHEILDEWMQDEGVDVKLNPRYGQWDASRASFGDASLARAADSATLRR